MNHTMDDLEFPAENGFFVMAIFLKNIELPKEGERDAALTFRSAMGQKAVDAGVLQPTVARVLAVHLRETAEHILRVFANGEEGNVVVETITSFDDPEPEEEDDATNE